MLPSDFPVFRVSALIVEDAPQLALDLGAMLAERGVEDIGYAKDLSEAAAAVARRPWGVVLLDITLGTHEDISLLAATLRETGVPFIFCTGYARPPSGFERVPLVRKPYTPAEIIAALIMAGVAAPKSPPAVDSTMDIGIQNLVYLRGRDKDSP